MATQVITVETTVNVPVARAWELWTQPEHITKWNAASEDWHTPRATNDLREGGTFTARMEAKDGSFGFDFEGVYDTIQINKRIEYTMADGRTVKVVFTPLDGATKVTESFDAESEHSAEMQRSGWQAILDNFKKYVEQNA